MSYLDEAQVEIVPVDYFHELGYESIHGPAIAPDGEAPGRADYGQVVFTRRLRDAMVRKLICGKLRVPDAERIFGRAV